MKVLGYDYELVREGEYERIGAFGRCHNDDLIIQIAVDIAPQQVASTVVHEILEALNACLELGLDHGTVMALEAGLYQVLTANGVDLSPLLAELEGAGKKCGGGCCGGH